MQDKDLMRNYSDNMDLYICMKKKNSHDSMQFCKKNKKHKVHYPMRQWFIETLLAVIS